MKSSFCNFTDLQQECVQLEAWFEFIEIERFLQTSKRESCRSWSQNTTPVLWMPDATYVTKHNFMPHICHSRQPISCHSLMTCHVESSPNDLPGQGPCSMTCHVTCFALWHVRSRYPVRWHTMSCHVTFVSPVTLPCPPAWFWPTVGVWGWLCYISHPPPAQAWGGSGCLQRWNIGKGQPVAAARGK